MITTNEMFELTGFQRDLLYVIASLDGAHGLGIKNEIETVYEMEVNHGRLYPNLDTLVTKGLVEKGRIDDRTNSYDITEQGEQLIASRREWEDELLSEEITHRSTTEA